MTWTTPKTWTNEPLIAGDLNTHLRDNMEALKDPPTAHVELDELTDYSTTSTTFVDVDATRLSLTVDTNGGAVIVGFAGAMQITGANFAYLDVTVDGTRFAGDNGLLGIRDTVLDNVSFVILVTNLSAGSHTFALQWRVNSGTATLFAGAGSTNTDLHPQFWVREVS